LNQFVKVYFDWQYAEFGEPVNHGGPNSFQRTSNLYWIRLQLYF
jgi:phosphate-selective porin OprO/OprP